MVKTRINKKAILLAVCAAAVLIAGCARVVDADGHTLEEKIIYLTTKWSDMMSEGFITVLLVYPLAQAINWVSSLLNSWIGMPYFLKASATAARRMWKNRLFRNST